MKKLKTASEGFYTEKKSKFICHLFNVDNNDDVQEILKSEKKKYFDAKHHCYAYVIGEDGSNVKCSDDGEPSGTAGRPMLEILQREEVTNILCVVTRYFGGTLLGTGGLVRAYSEALKDSLSKSEFASESEAFILKFRYAYNYDTKISAYFRDEKVKILSSDYSDAVIVETVIPSDKKESVCGDINNLTKGSIEILDEVKCFYEL